MKKINLLLTLFFVCCISAVLAQKATLLAHYPLLTNGKEATTKAKDAQIVNVVFKEGVAYLGGIYGDFNAGVGNMMRSASITELNYQDFSVNIFFKVSKLDDMPVLVMGKSCRLLIFYLAENGTVMLKGNNGVVSKSSTTKYQPNQWHEATITYKNGLATIYLDKKQAVQTEIIFDNMCVSEYENKDFTNVNFANGEIFEGYLKHLKIYNGNVITENTSTEVTTEVIIEVTGNNNNNNNNNNGNANGIIKTPLGELQKVIFAVEGTPADALNTQNGQPRKFYLMQNPVGEVESIWQDVKTKKIYLTKFNKNLSSSQNILLTSANNTDILAATNDNEGNYYYMVAKANTDATTNDLITLYKADKQGKMMLSKTQASDEKTLNVFRVGSYSATLRHKEGVLAFMMGRIMNKSSDGLNHQGGIAVIFDPQTLLITRNFGQTSGHSFDNFLEKGKDDNFIAIDLGDNYPRGIHLHKFSKDNIKSKVIYTFKTYHGTTADGYGKIYPLYEEISTPTQKYYKWSNDNGVYTELGGVVEVADGYCVIFSGEPDANGKSMNSAKIGQNNDDPRNLGFMKIKKDFENVTAKGWNVVPKEIVLSKGISETGGFYTFGGRWTEQANEGVTWLTKYKSKETESVRHIKTAVLPNGNILVLYVKGKKEGWRADPIEKSFMMCISPNGAIVVPEFDLGADLRLNRRDEILVIGNQVFVMQGKETDKKLELFVLNLK